MRWLVVVCALVGSARADVIVAGNPPLTDDIVDRTCDFLEWAIDTPFTRAQRDEARDLLAKSWRAKDAKTIAGVQQILAARDQVAKAAPDARTAAQHKVETDLIAGMRKETQDPTSRWLLAIYDGAHTSLVTGGDPLTRQMVDAYAELLGFLAGIAKSGTPIVPTRKDEDALAKSLIAAWSKTDAAQRQQFAQIPAYWAAVRVQWAAASAADRKKFREQLVASMKPKPHQSAQQLMEQYQMAMMAEKARHEMVQHTICAMNSNCTWHYEYRWDR